MFVLSRDVSAAKRVIATLLASAIVLWASGAFNIVRAENVIEASDLLSDSAPGAGSDHTITFILASELANGQDIVIDFDSDNGFDFTGVTTTDFAITTNGGGTFSEAVDTVNDTITFTSTGAAVPAGSLVTVTIDGPNKIVNPTPAEGNQSYEIDISAGTDTGHTRVVILDTVLVTATVDTIFEFTVTGLDDGVDVNGDTTTVGASSTSIPFGTLTAFTPVVLAQELQVITNAINGFVVTIESDGTLRSSTGAEIDDFVDGSSTNAPTAWTAPSNDVTMPNTWGHWGITTEDQDAADDMRTAEEFAAGEWIGVSTTPRQVFAHNGPSDGFTPDVGSTTIGFKVEISPLQEAADDYATTLTYIATPTF